MRVARVLRAVFALLVALILVAAAGLWLFPPELLRVGSGYAAKIVCSNVFVAGRDAGTVLADDVQAPGHPLLRIMQVSVDREARAVHAGILGFIAGRTAVARDGLGCTLLPDETEAALGPTPPARDWPVRDDAALWPDGEAVAEPRAAAVNRILDDETLAGPGMRAIVVVRNGRIIGERYAEGFDAKTPLLGWSMTKTVNMAILGTVVGDRRLTVDRSGLLPEWNGDDRTRIKVADLAAMASGLEFNESYGDVSDVTRMLFLEPDMAGFTASKPSVAAPGTTFNYSSGTSLVLARIWQDALGSPETAVDWPREKLFEPLGMTSAVLETDGSGTFVGSSYLYATPHDWARFALFLMQGGSWKGVPVLPPGFVAWMREPAEAGKGEYGRGQLWLRGPDENKPGGGPLPDLPDDTFWMIGHDGQSAAMVPSRNLIVLRMGLTPSKLGYRPHQLVAALVAASDEVPE